MTGDDTGEIARFNTGRQCIHAPDLLILQPVKGGEHLVPQFTVTNGFDGSIQLCRLVLEHADGLLIGLQGLRIGLKLLQAIGQRQHGFIHGGVGTLALGQHHPGHNGLLVIFFHGIGPTQAQ